MNPAVMRSAESDEIRGGVGSALTAGEDVVRIETPVAGDTCDDSLGDASPVAKHDLAVDVLRDSSAAAA